MSGFDENELDNAFRMSFEGKELEPPPSVWKAVRTSALEHQLIRYQSMNLWLKGITGALTVLLGGTSYFWYQAAQQAKQTPTAQVITVTKTDTVFVPNTQTERVFVAVPAPSEPVADASITKVERQSDPNLSNESLSNDPTPTTTLNSTHTTDEVASVLPESKNSSVAKVSQRNSPVALPLTPAEATTPLTKEENSTAQKDIASAAPFTKSNVNGTTEQPENETVESSKTTSKKASRRNEQLVSNQLNTAKTAKNRLNQQSPVADSSPLYAPTTDASSGSVNPVANSAETEAQAPVPLLASMRVEQLKSLPYQFEFEQKEHKVRFRSALKPSIPIKLLRPRTPFIERLSLSAYYSPEWNDLSIRRDEPTAFGYANQDVSNGSAFGLRIGVKLSDRWSVQTGIEHSSFSFEEKEKYQFLRAEDKNGRLCFVYRTALGTVEVPFQQLNYQPKPGDPLRIENRGLQHTSAWRIPVTFRYNFLDKTWQAPNSSPLTIRIYGLGGVSITMPKDVNTTLEILAPNGRESIGTLNDFQNLQTAWGFNLGAGAEIGLGRRTFLWVEPNYNQNLSSFVKDMPITSSVGTIGLKMGLKWEFARK
ncbi:MAG: hypothetical protein U0Y10_05010 [Spirosomataceae bacterium]